MILPSSVGPGRYLVNGLGTLGPLNGALGHPTAGPEELLSICFAKKVADLRLAVQADCPHAVATAIGVGAIGGKTVAT